MFRAWLAVIVEHRTQQRDILELRGQTGTYHIVGTRHAFHTIYGTEVAVVGANRLTQINIHCIYHVII